MMFKYIHLPTDSPVSLPMEMNKFKCLLLIERDVGSEYRHQVSAALVAAGCLYTLAWGRDGSAWDEAVDWAFLEHYDFGEYPEDAFVMTTWHEDEALEDTMCFAKHCTQYSNVQIDDILVLDFVDQERSDLIENFYLNS